MCQRRKTSSYCAPAEIWKLDFHVRAAINRITVLCSAWIQNLLFIGVVQPLVEFVLVNSLHMSFDVLCTDGNCVLDLRPWVCKKAFMVCGLSVQTVLIWSVFLSKAILIDVLISQLHFAFYKTQRKWYHASVSASNSYIDHMWKIQKINLLFF